MSTALSFRPRSQLGFPEDSFPKIMEEIKAPRQFRRGWDPRTARAHFASPRNPKPSPTSPGPASGCRAVIYGGGGEP